MSQEGYVTETGEISITENTTLNVNLSREMIVTIDAMPDDAEIEFIGE